MRIPPVCLSVRLSHASIVTKWIKLRSQSLHRRTAPSSEFSAQWRLCECTRSICLAHLQQRPLVHDLVLSCLNTCWWWCLVTFSSHHYEQYINCSQLYSLRDVADMSKVPSIRSWLDGTGAEYDYIDVRLDEEYINRAYARLQSVAQNLLQEPIAHQRWFRKSPSSYFYALSRNIEPFIRFSS